MLAGISLAQAATVITPQIAEDGRTAALSLNGKTIHATILTPNDVRFTTASTQPLPPQEPNTGLTNLVIQLSHQSVPATIEVLFSELEGPERVYALTPLSAWK